MSKLPGRKFFKQLKKRKVVRVALVYVIVGWVVMQVGEVVLEGLGVPSWSLSLLIVMVLLGFPIALVLAWAYELTPHGIRKESSHHIESVTEIDDFQEGAPSIAVLPFDDMSEKGNQQYFCDGIAEEILNALCKVANLRVASRVSSFRFATKQDDIKEIGRKLRVQSILEGSVLKAGENLRITAQLVNTVDGFHMWSRQYDRALDDVFEIQEEIATSIATALSVSLKRKNIAAQQKVDPKAYDFFLRGLSYFAMHTTQYNVYARQMFKQAIDVEPEFGRAWAGIASTYGFEYMYFNASNVNLEEAKRASNI